MARSPIHLLIIFELEAVALSSVETPIDLTPYRVPLFGGEHVVISHGIENMIGNNLPGTSPMNANEIKSSVCGILGERHCLGGDHDTGWSWCRSAGDTACDNLVAWNA